MSSKYSPEVERLLKDADRRFERHGKGSHDIWYSPVSARKFTFPHKIKKATANGVLKDAGLPKAFQGIGIIREPHHAFGPRL